MCDSYTRVAAAHAWQLHVSGSCACVTAIRKTQLRMWDSYTWETDVHCACVTATRKLQLLIYNSDTWETAAHVWQLHVSSSCCACALLSIPEILGLLQQLCSTPGVQIGIQIIKVKWSKTNENLLHLLWLQMFCFVLFGKFSSALFSKLMKDPILALSSTVYIYSYICTAVHNSLHHPLYTPLHGF